MTGKELFEADMARYNSKSLPTWGGLTMANCYFYRRYATKAIVAGLSMEKALDLVDAARHKVWVEQEFPPWKGK